jgi:hypothetical protein
MNIVNRTKLWENLYYKDECIKNKIILHHTASAGNIFQDEYYLRISSSKAFRDKGYYIGVNYYVGRDGTIIKAIPDQNWAWNTGTGSITLERQLISIEIDNLGYLDRLSKDQFQDIYNQRWEVIDHNNDLYTITNGNQEIVIKELPNEWRGYKYYEIYDDTLIDTLCQLLETIFKDNPFIKRKIMTKDKFLPEQKLPLSDILKFSGIITHVQLLGEKPRPNTNKNYSYKKWDLSIVFPYEKLVKNLNLEIEK